MAKFEGLIRAKQERALTETDCFCQWRVSYFVIVMEQLEASKSRQKFATAAKERGSTLRILDVIAI